MSDTHPHRPSSDEEPSLDGGPGYRPAAPTVLRGPLTALAVVTGLTTAVLAVLVAGGSVGLPVDTELHTAVATWWGEPGRPALLIDFLGDPRSVAVAIAVLAAVCLALGRRRLAVVAVLGPVLTGALTTGLKPVVGRTIHGDNLAYPSGHTASSTALAVVAALLVAGVIGAGVVGALLLVVAMSTVAGGAMALAQIALDAHYPTDVLGGFCCAITVVAAVALLVDRALDRTAGRRMRRAAG
ncbi:phosphatase PAP2 family protein [Pseudonocardia lacus]|uniref:phosphatase PAP2 family protein n=1 Tax=Pseudonocardia lacus TaxID=2835865 RepID=UPI001BDC1ABD|nr:phosphatase PAP2 family protein [Pseudonocardia lacus]